MADEVMIEDEGSAFAPRSGKAASVTVGEKRSVVDAEIIDLSDDENGGADDDDEIVLESVKKKAKSQFMPKEASWIAESLGSVDSTERKGYIKEYINTDGQGVIYSESSGLIFFNLKHFYVNGERLKDVRAGINKYTPGTDVTFIEKAYKSEDFKVVSRDKFIRQATALWIGTKPATLLKDVKRITHEDDLGKDRKSLKDFAGDGSFLRMAIVRGRGMVTGFIDKQYGLLETQDDPEAAGDRTKEPRTLMIMFHINDVYINKISIEKNLHHAPPVQDLMPPGLRCYFDAKSIKPFRGICYQATSIMIGEWPKTPHPTMLPSDQSVCAPCYNVPRNFGFFHLNLFRDSQLDSQLYNFKQVVAVKGTNLMKTDLNIDSSDDFYRWQEKYCPGKIKERRPGGPRRNKGKSEYVIEFKEAESYIVPFEEKVDTVKLERMEKEGVMKDQSLVKKEKSS